MTEADIEKAEQKLEGEELAKGRLFQESQPPVLGMKLRPYSAWTCQLLEQIKLPLKVRIQSLSKTNGTHNENCKRQWRCGTGCTISEPNGEHAVTCVATQAWECAEGCFVRWQSQQSTFWYIAAFLYVHSAPEAEVDEAAWNMDKLMTGVKSLIRRYSYEDILAAYPLIAQIVDAPTKVTNYETADKGTGPPRPNS